MPYDGFIPIVYRELVKVNGRRIIILNSYGTGLG